MRCPEQSPSDAAVYVLVNTLLLVLNLMNEQRFFWFLISLICWGIGLTMHYLYDVRFAGRQTQNWQAKVELRAARPHHQP